MLMLPLNSPILLITTGGKFIGRVTHAGSDFIRMIDTVERILTSNGDFLYTDMELSGVIHFNRDHIVGYKTLDESELYEEEKNYTNSLVATYNKTIQETKRKKFQVINCVRSTTKNKEEISL